MDKCIGNCSTIKNRYALKKRRFLSMNKMSMKTLRVGCSIHKMVHRLHTCSCDNLIMWAMACSSEQS